MPRDAELDRLRSEKDQAYQRMQDAYDAMQQAWEHRSSAREDMNRAFERNNEAYNRKSDAYSRQEDAYGVQNAAWTELDGLQSRYGSRLDALKDQNERAHRNMQDAFERASRAYDARDGASASAYAAEGHAYKQERNDCTEERRGLIQQLQQARDRLNAVRPDTERAKAAFQYAKAEADRTQADFDRAKAIFERAKADHESKKTDFNRFRSDFNHLKEAYGKRLASVREAAKKRREEKRAIAERAGVPAQYCDNVWISKKPDGTVHIYFGGIGEPNGEGHGHYVVNVSGEVSYRRDPFDPHGPQNFTDVVYWNKVKMSYDRDSGTYQTDNFIGIVGSTDQKSKAHIAVNPDGEIVYVRDIGGEILYDKKNGIGHLPKDLDWSK